MTIEEAFTAYLTSDTAVKALVQQRVYPKQAPQGVAFPVIVYHRISGQRESSQLGPSGLAAARFQLDLFARTYAQALELATKVRTILDGYPLGGPPANPMGFVSGGAAGVNVGAVFLEDDDDGYDDELKVYWVRQDYTFWHEE